MASMAKDRWIKGLILAAALVLVLGAGAVYVRSLLDGNVGVSEACRAAVARAAGLEPLAKGEIAAFIVEKHPVAAPDLAFKDGEGHDHTLAEFRGRTVLLNLWATWCVPCRQEMPALDRLQAALGGDTFQVAAVSTDLGSPDKPRRFLDEARIGKLAFYQDPTGKVFQEMRAAGRAIGMPATMLVDDKGCILGHIPGPADWASDDARRLIAAALAKRG